MCGDFEEGEKNLLQVTNTSDIVVKELISSLTFYQCLCKACMPKFSIIFFINIFWNLDIKNGKPKLAWNLFLKSRHLDLDSTVKLLRLIANECYSVGSFVLIYYNKKWIIFLDWRICNSCKSFWRIRTSLWKWCW